ncbi:MAG: hypothetical protein Q9183_004722 [Haloplaca sp. 2 TL-2023]
MRIRRSPYSHPLVSANRIENMTRGMLMAVAGIRREVRKLGRLRELSTPNLGLFCGDLEKAQRVRTNQQFFISSP